jgi:hypothetical protein
MLCGAFVYRGCQFVPAYVATEEFKVLQDEVEGEKLVTRHILEQTGSTAKILLR